MCFVLQAMVVGFLPILGPVISLGHMCLLYSLYTFEYKWVNMGELHFVTLFTLTPNRVNCLFLYYFIGWTAPKRLMYMESNWPYFVGFGFPLAILTSLAPSFIIRLV